MAYLMVFLKEKAYRST